MLSEWLMIFFMILVVFTRLSSRVIKIGSSLAQEKRMRKLKKKKGKKKNRRS